MKGRMDGFFAGLLAPINPNLSILLGFLNVIYGAWMFIPSDQESQTIYRYLDFIVDGKWWGLFIVCVGLLMIYLNRTGRIKNSVKPMAFNSIMWTAIAAFVATGDIYNNVWIPMAFIAIYSMFVAANLWINYSYKKKT